MDIDSENKPKRICLRQIQSSNENAKCPQPSIECPICFEKFPKSKIEEHCATCTLLISDNGDEKDSIIDFIGEEENGNIEKSDTSVRNSLDEIIDAQSESSTQNLRILRYKAWQIYIEHCKKKWFKPTSKLTVTFIDEDAAGDGLLREFFQGIYIQNNFSSLCHCNLDV